jgi:hypothetical protein
MRDHILRAQHAFAVEESEEHSNDRFQRP